MNKYSLVYTWEGTDKSLKPIMICSHLDVVPAPENNENASMNWTHPPFAGKVVDGEIWGRGAVSERSERALMKTSILAMNPARRDATRRDATPTSNTKTNIVPINSFIIKLLTISLPLGAD